MNSAMLNLEISECGMFLILLESIASQKGKWAPVSLKHWSHGSMILYMNQLEATSFGSSTSLNEVWEINSNLEATSFGNGTFLNQV